jgi:hypothetical protein
MFGENSGFLACGIFATLARTEVRPDRAKPVREIRAIWRPVFDSALQMAPKFDRL